MQDGVCWIKDICKQADDLLLSRCDIYVIERLCSKAVKKCQLSPDVWWEGFSIDSAVRVNKLYVRGWSQSIPVLHYLLSDHLDVFKALHTANVVYQDVGIGVSDTPAAQIQPLLMETERERNTDSRAS